MTVNDASRVMGQVAGLRADILARNDALRQAASPAPQAAKADFTAALQAVSQSQDRAASVSEAFERGDMTDIAAVMVARQKASVAFEATVQVRNKLLGAYRDVMNMGA